MIYTVIPLGYMQYINGLLAKFENFSTSFLQEVFDFLKPVDWKIIIVAGYALHLQRQELPFRIVHKDNMNSLRLDPLEPQQFSVPVLQYHKDYPCRPMRLLSLNGLTALMPR